MTKPKKIKPLDSFANVSDADVVSRCTNIQTSMTGNPHFPDPPAEVEHGPNSGQITVWLKAVAGASSYEIHSGVANATALVWTSAPASSVKAPIVLTGLTRQRRICCRWVRALIKNTYTDWSDSITFICT